MQDIINKYDPNCYFNNMFSDILVGGELNDVVSRSLNTFKNFLATHCERYTTTHDPRLITPGLRYICTRVCDLTADVVEFSVEFLTYEEESTNVIRFNQWHREESHEFFKKTVEDSKMLMADSSNYSVDNDLVILRPNVSKLQYVSDYNPSAYVKCHPGLGKPLTSDQLREEWDIIKQYFTLDEKVALDVIGKLALKGTPVPLHIYDDVLSCEVSVNLMICLIAIFTCNPLIPYADAQVNYFIDERLHRIIIEASQKDELCKRQVARFLYALKIRDIPLGLDVNVESEWLSTLLILESAM